MPSDLRGHRIPERATVAIRDVHESSLGSSRGTVNVHGVAVPSSIPEI